jgi:FkbM family methyltransferase
MRGRAAADNFFPIGIRMKTAQKIALARLAYRTIHLARAAAGRSDRCIVARDGVNFDLDLAEGIDFAIYLGVFERGTRSALKKLVKPLSVVLDIGANIGVHTLLLADLVGSSGRVLSFEPTEFAIRKLRRNLELNPDLAKRVTPFHCFLASKDGAEVPGSIYSSWPLTEAEELHGKHLGQAMPTDTARARSIDGVLAELGGPAVQLVKIDVDGFESEVLRGATALLRDVRPIFVMELSPYVLVERGSSLQELLSFFVPNGYRFFHERTGDRLPSEVAELSRLVGDGASMNIVARVS